MDCCEFCYFSIEKGLKHLNFPHTSHAKKKNKKPVIFWLKIWERLKVKIRKKGNKEEKEDTFTKKVCVFWSKNEQKVCMICITNKQFSCWKDRKHFNDFAFSLIQCESVVEEFHAFHRSCSEPFQPNCHYLVFQVSESYTIWITDNEKSQFQPPLQSVNPKDSSFFRLCESWFHLHSILQNLTFLPFRKWHNSAVSFCICCTLTSWIQDLRMTFPSNWLENKKVKILELGTWKHTAIEEKNQFDENKFLFCHWNFLNWANHLIDDSFHLLTVIIHSEKKYQLIEAIFFSW